MSEYQYIAFRAVDRPLTNEQIIYAREQSTRAAITHWSFENEYHYGDFHGNVNGLLRHGYDVHLHYANFGIRTIAFRLSAGLPFKKSVWSKYSKIGTLKWTKDRNGAGGILSLSPYHEGGELEEIWNVGEYVDDIVEIRNRFEKGDLRVLYLLWLIAAFDDQVDPSDVIEPPVPGGLSDCLQSFEAILDFFGLDPLILLAASAGAPSTLKEESLEDQIAAWIEGLTSVESKQLLNKLLSDDSADAKAETIKAIRHAGNAPDWPTAAKGRSFEELYDRTEILRTEQYGLEQEERKAAEEREAAKKERERQNRMKKMVKEPQKWLRKAEKLVEERGTQNYKEAAGILVDLREAVGGEEGKRVTHKHAAHLVKKHPTLRHLKSSLRKNGLL